MRSSNTVIDAQGKGVDQTDPLKFHPCATSVGSDNAPDPETGAELMKAKLAALDTAADVADKPKANNDTPTAEPIPFNDAIREGKEILAQKSASESKCQWRLGELADKVETAYREGTLKRFAKAIGISECTLGRYRDVYRAWKDISAPGRESLSYAVARELAAHPDRAEIVRDNPDITKREAAKIRRELAPKRNQDGEPTPGDGATTPAEKNNRRVAQQIAKITNELIKAADFARPGVSIEQEQLDDLRARFEPLLPQLKQGREIYSWLIDDLCGKVMPVEPARVAKPASSEDGDEEVNLPTAPRRSHRNGGHDREDEDVRVCSETELAPSEPQDCLTAETAESEAV